MRSDSRFESSRARHFSRPSWVAPRADLRLRATNHEGRLHSGHGLPPAASAGVKWGLCRRYLVVRCSGAQTDVDLRPSALGEDRGCGFDVDHRQINRVRLWTTQFHLAGAAFGSISQEARTVEYKPELVVLPVSAEGLVTGNGWLIQEVRHHAR